MEADHAGTVAEGLTPEHIHTAWTCGVNPAYSRARTSRYKGVYLQTDGKWRAQICVNYRKLNLGSYATEIAAARVYDAAALEHFGEFARLNFPMEANRA